MTSTCWLISEKFNSENEAEFRMLLADGRLNHIGYCLPTGRTGDFSTADEAFNWIASGRNVYADVRMVPDAT